MEWVKILSETNNKNKKNHVIKGIAQIDDDLYLLDYILFSNFEWWTAIYLESENELETAQTQTPSLYYNSSLDRFYTGKELPLEIKKNI